VVSLQADFSTAHGRVILDADSDASITTIRFTPTVPLGVICHDLKFEYEYEQNTESASPVLNGGCTVAFKADKNAAKEAVIELKVNPQNGMEPSDLLLRFLNNTAKGRGDTGRLWYGYRLDDIAVTKNSIHVVLRKCVYTVQEAQLWWQRNCCTALCQSNAT